jgi:hypothetical protein
MSKKRTYTEAEELERDDARFALGLVIPNRRLAKVMAHRASQSAYSSPQAPVAVLSSTGLVEISAPTEEAPCSASVEMQVDAYSANDSPELLDCDYLLPLRRAYLLPPADHFAYLKTAHSDAVVPGCQKAHGMLLRHIGMFSSNRAKHCLCCALGKYTHGVYRWLVDNGFDDMIFEWAGPPRIIESGGRFRYDILIRMKNGDLVSVELDDGGHFRYSKPTPNCKRLPGHRRRRDMVTYKWALSNGMKVLRVSTTTNIERYLADAFPNGPDTVMDQITLVGPDTHRYYYLDGVDLYCYENIDDLLYEQPISISDGLEQS